jgi:hypothetical protein
VFSRDDLDPVESHIKDWFRAAVEYRRKEPALAAAFGYESDHFIFVIDEHMKPDGWENAGPNAIDVRATSPNATRAASRSILKQNVNSRGSQLRHGGRPNHE